MGLDELMTYKWLGFGDGQSYPCVEILHDLKRLIFN